MAKVSSELRVLSYVETRGLIVRELSRERILGYCLETPHQILKKAFSDFYFTEFLGHELFSSYAGFRGGVIPKRGIGINAVNPKYLFDEKRLYDYFEDLQSSLIAPGSGLRRKGPFSREELEDMSETLSSNPNRSLIVIGSTKQELREYDKELSEKRFVSRLVDRQMKKLSLMR